MKNYKCDEVKNIYSIEMIRGNIPVTHLQSLGYSAYKIQKLVKDGIIIPVAPKIYMSSSIKFLYEIGVQELKTGSKKVAEIYLERCYSLNPDYENIAFYMFCLNILKRKFKNSLTYFDGIIAKENSAHMKDALYYLFLESFLIDIPESLKGMIESLELNDVLLTENSSESYENRIRTLALQLNFSLALKLVVQAQSEKCDFQSEIEEALFLEINKKGIQLSHRNHSAFSERNCREMVEIYTDEKNRPQLKRGDILRYIPNYLYIGDYVNANILTELFLKTIEKTRYIEFIKSATKLSILENDEEYTTLTNILTDLAAGIDNFAVSVPEAFGKALENNDLKEAECYIEMIRALSRICMDEARQKEYLKLLKSMKEQYEMIMESGIEIKCNRITPIESVE